MRKINKNRKLIDSHASISALNEYLRGMFSLMRLSEFINFIINYC